MEYMLVPPPKDVSKMACRKRALITGSSTWPCQSAELTVIPLRMIVHGYCKPVVLRVARFAVFLGPAFQSFFP